MIRILISLFIILISLKGDAIFEYMKSITHQVKISPFILYSVAKTETNVNKYAIGIKSYYSKSIGNIFRKYGIKVKVNENKHFLSVLPKNKFQAKLAYKILKKLNRYIVTYDLGLMQINKYNLRNKNELSYLLNYKKNIKLASHILYKCFLRFKNSYKGYAKIFECYNKGFNDEKFTYSYFNRFYNNYLAVIRKYKRQITKQYN